MPAFGDAGGLVDGNSRLGVGDPTPEVGLPVASDGEADGAADAEDDEDADGVPEEHPARNATAIAPIARYRATIRSM